MQVHVESSVIYGAAGQVFCSFKLVIYFTSASLSVLADTPSSSFNSHRLCDCGPLHLVENKIGCS